MTPTPPPMTEEQKIAYLAEKVMGWKKRNEPVVGEIWVCFQKGVGDLWIEVRFWNPLTDWNHWRQVEEKIVLNQNLLEAFIVELGTPKNATPYIATGYLLAVGLPTRVDALIQAHSPLLHGE